MIDGHSLVDSYILIEVDDLVHRDGGHILRDVAEAATVADYSETLGQSEELVHSESEEAVALSRGVTTRAGVAVNHSLGHKDAAIGRRIMDLVRVAIVALAHVERGMGFCVEVELGIDLILTVGEVEVHAATPRSTVLGVG
jgi:hypothetical protein